MRFHFSQRRQDPQSQIDLPNCDRCGTRMWIARIEPDGPKQEKWTFECSACDAVKVDIKSAPNLASR